MYKNIVRFEIDRHNNFMSHLLFVYVSSLSDKIKRRDNTDISAFLEYLNCIFNEHFNLS